jgi:dihydrofolate reductase
VAALLYSAIASLDGYTVDADGSFAWARPAADVHAHVNEQEAAVGTYLYGRRMYETMKVWQQFGSGPDEPAVIRRYGEVWRGADKIVYSTTLDAVSTPRTRLERKFDPEAVRALKDTAGADVSIGGPTLAAAALRAGLVDELQIYVIPVVVGGGTPWLPDGIRLRLDLRDQRRFADGTVQLRYATRPWA